YGYIKNLCKDGGYYWVFAHIRPQFDGNGEISGYRSVRRAPKPSAVAAVEELYASMRRAEQASTPDKAIAAGLDVLRGFLASRGQSYEQMVVSL
ncbi:MAG: aerotaxis receptor Aer, partial [Rhodocyclaceae bacterium]|nr:aerotaxis receptor Aer [Rhodocyclaceae bacterium]